MDTIDFIIGMSREDSDELFTLREKYPLEVPYDELSEFANNKGQFKKDMLRLNQLMQIRNDLMIAIQN